MLDSELVAAASGVFSLGGNVAVTRLRDGSERVTRPGGWGGRASPRCPRRGYGSMRITGRGGWGEPADRGAAIRVLRRAVELGVDFIDTADSYGPFVSEGLIREALYPYDRVTSAT